MDEQRASSKDLTTAADGPLDSTTISCKDQRQQEAGAQLVKQMSTDDDPKPDGREEAGATGPNAQAPGKPMEQSAPRTFAKKSSLSMAGLEDGRTSGGGGGGAEVVRMDTSPNNESRLSRAGEDFVDSTASDSNLITSIEIIDPATSGRLEVRQRVGRPEQADVSVELGQREAGAVGQLASGRAEQRRKSSLAAKNNVDENGNHSDATTQNLSAKICSRDELGANRADVISQSGSGDNARPSGTVGCDGGSGGGGGGAGVGAGAGGGQMGRAARPSAGNMAAEQQVAPALHRDSSMAHHRTSAGQAKAPMLGPINGALQPDRRCRLCWCCCCPCSA